MLLAACMGAFLVTLDVTIINLALPSIQRDFRVTLAQGSWVINAYTLTFASLVILGGKLGDVFGREKFLLIGFVVFGMGSIIGGVAQDIHTVQAARVVQGLGGAMMMPGSLSVLTAAFQNRNLSLAIGLWGGIAALGLIAGPIVSGAFTSLINWRAIFLLNLPPGGRGRHAGLGRGTRVQGLHHRPPHRLLGGGAQRRRGVSINPWR